MIFGRENPMVFNNHLPFNYHSPIIRQPILLDVGILVGEENFKAFSHVHSEAVELVFAARGNGCVHLEGKMLPFNRGDIFAVNPGLTHYEDFSGSAESCVLYMCQFSMLQLYRLPAGYILPAGIPEVIHTGDQMDTFIHIFKTLFDESCNQSFGYERILYARLESLILCLYRLYKSFLPYDFSSGDDHDNIAVAAKAFMDQHIHTNISLQNICDALLVSGSYLCHVFASYYHISPTQYLIGRRINESMQMLLTSNLSVKEIAGKAGFNNLSNFNSHFRKHVGICPSQYRKNRMNKVNNTNHWTVVIK
ncbi:MAG: AraC family transcriptional regulator [Treponema sp.]|jgi:AraC-like DNA-binding protein|nr:AraC family transcriptional regulator [Treponema sp.]